MSAPVDTLFAVSLWTRCQKCRATPSGICADHAATDNTADDSEWCRICGQLHQPDPLTGGVSLCGSSEGMRKGRRFER